MKRKLLMLLAVALSIGLTACGSTADGDASPKPQEDIPTAEEAEIVEDALPEEAPAALESESLAPADDELPQDPPAPAENEVSQGAPSESESPAPADGELPQEPPTAGQWQGQFPDPWQGQDQDQALSPDQWQGQGQHGPHGGHRPPGGPGQFPGGQMPEQGQTPDQNQMPDQGQIPWGNWPGGGQFDSQTNDIGDLPQSKEDFDNFMDGFPWSQGHSQSQGESGDQLQGQSDEPEKPAGNPA